MSQEYDDLKAQAAKNKSLLGSITQFLNGLADKINQGVAAATELGQLKTSMTAITAEMKAQDDETAAALVSLTPAADPSVTPPGTVPIVPPATA